MRWNNNQMGSGEWHKMDAEGWWWRNASMQDKVLLRDAGKLGHYKDGRAYVSSPQLKDRLDRGLMIKE
jgi:hypothetical protein